MISTTPDTPNPPDLRITDMRARRIAAHVAEQLGVKNAHRMARDMIIERYQELVNSRQIKPVSVGD